ncbi:MAG: hypothetical protein ABIS67_09405 [Candidatus Eisenbacteria bacterium]
MRFKAPSFAVLAVAAAFPAWGLLTSIGSAPAFAASSDEILSGKLTGFVAASYDSARGGFVTRDRTPNASAVELAWRLSREGDAAWRGRARRTVEWTWSLYDSVGGGFLESERDARRDVASFEKHTDSNAWRLENLVDAWLDSRSEAGRAAGAGAYANGDRNAIRQILDFFDRVLLDGRGGFVAGQVGDRELIPAANGPAIRATLRWAAAAGEPRWRDFAWKSLDRLWTSGWNAEWGFLRLGAMGQVTSVPRLDDQVEMGRAFVLAAHVAGRQSDLVRAQAIGELLLKHFEDRKQGGMRVQVSVAKDGRVRSAARDAEPNARAARFLGELASVTGDARFRDAARRLVENFVPNRNRPAVDDADWVLAIRGLTRTDLPARGEWTATPAKAPTPPPRGKPKPVRVRR